MALLSKSALKARDRAGQIRVALAIHLFVVDQISIGKAAELSGETYRGFMELLQELGIPAFRYELAEYHQNTETMRKLDRKDDPD